MSDERELTAADGERDHELGLLRKYSAGPLYQFGYEQAERKAEGSRRARLTPEQRKAEDAKSSREGVIVLALGAIVAAVYFGATWIESIVSSQSWLALYYQPMIEVPLRVGVWINEYFEQAVPGNRRGSFRVPDIVATTAVIIYAAFLLWLLYIVFWRFRVLRWVATVLLVGPFAVGALRHYFG